MQTKNTGTFAVSNLHPLLKLLSLRNPVGKRPLCRVTVSPGEIRFETLFARGSVGVKVPAVSGGTFAFAVPIGKIEGLQYVDGEVSYELTGNELRSTTSGGGSGVLEAAEADLVPQVESPPLLGKLPAPALRELLALCVPFASGSVRRRGSVVTTGDATRSIEIEVSGASIDWTIPRDAATLVRDYLAIVSDDADVELLGQAERAGLATAETRVVWPCSALPEVAPLRAARGEPLRVSSELMATSAAFMCAEVGRDAQIDLVLADQGLQLSWRAGGEAVQHAAVPYLGTPVQHRLQVFGPDLWLLFRHCAQDEVELTLEIDGEAAILTTTESLHIQGEAAVVRRSIVARVRGER